MRREYEREGTSASTKLTYLLVGGCIGAILALLFAPKSGEELRGDIADATRKGIEKGKEAATQLQAKAGEYYDAASEKAGDLYHSAQEKASELGDKARAASARTTNPFTAAIEAGKDAYTAEKRRGEANAITEGRASYPVEKKDDK